MTMRRVPLRLGIDRFSGVYLFAGFLAVFGLWTPNLFLTSGTLHSVATQQAVPAMLALALLAPLACGAYDLSIGATANLSAILAAYLQVSRGLTIGDVFIVCVATGALVGLINGILVTRFGISSFIATLGMATIVQATQEIVTGGNQPNPPISSSWRAITQTTVGGFQIVVVYLLVLAVLVWWGLEHTPAGRYMSAIGSNAEATRLTGVRTGAWTTVALVVSGSLSALAGVFYCSLAGPSLTFGGALLLPAYAAAFLGCTQLKPGRFNVWGTMLAVYVLATGVQGLELVTSVQWLNDMFNGCTLIVAVGFAVSRQRKGRGRTAPKSRVGGSSPGRSSAHLLRGRDRSTHTSDAGNAEHSAAH